VRPAFAPEPSLAAHPPPSLAGDADLSVPAAGPSSAREPGRGACFPRRAGAGSVASLASATDEQRKSWTRRVALVFLLLRASAAGGHLPDRRAGPGSRSGWRSPSWVRVGHQRRSGGRHIPGVDVAARSRIEL